MAELRVNKIEDLKNCDEPFDESDNYVKAVRFADDKLKEQLESDLEFVKEHSTSEHIYQDAVCKMNDAFEKAAIKEFEKISGYKDSDEKIELCQNRIEKRIAEKSEKKKKFISVIILVLLTFILIYVYYYRNY